MDHDSARLPKSVQCWERVGWWRIHIEADRSKCVSTMDEDINQSHRLRGSKEMELPIGRRAESISHSRDRQV
jgi:hypothetical protein